MNTFFYIAMVINFFVYIYAFLRDIQSLKKNNTFKKIFNAGKEMGENVEITYNELDSKAKKAGYLIGVIISVLIILGLYFLIIFIPARIGVLYGVNYALSTYLAFLLVTTLPFIYKYGSQSNHDPKVIVLMALVAIFKFQILTILLFGVGFNLDGIVEGIYTSDFSLRYTFSIIYPVLYFMSIILSFYLFWVGLRLNSKQKSNVPYKPRLNQVFLVIVISSFSGLIYFSEKSFDFIDWTSGEGFDRVWNIFLLILASVLIPVLFNLFSRRPSKVESESDLLKEETKNEKI